MDRKNLGLSPQDQIKVLIWLLKIPALLSMAGSLSIIYSILKYKAKRENGYHRLCLGMSFSDFLTSFWLFVASWAVPEEDMYSYMNHGNRQTCSAQGFFVQLGLTTPLYNLSLCIHLMMSVCYNWGRQRQKLRKVEILLHVLPWIVGIGTASAGLALELYNSMHTVCWIQDYPTYCSYFPHVGCIRAENANLYRYTLYIAPLAVWFVVCFAALFKVFRFVYSQDRKMSHRILRSSKTWDRNRSDSNRSITEQLQGRRSSRSIVNLGQTKMLAWSIFYYTLAFFATWLPMLIQVLQAIIKGEFTFLVRAALHFFWPLQGFLNFLVYFKVLERLRIWSFFLSCFEKCFSKERVVSRRESAQLSSRNCALVACIPENLSDVDVDKSVHENGLANSVLEKNCNTTAKKPNVYKMNGLTQNSGTQQSTTLHTPGGKGMECERLSGVSDDYDCKGDYGDADDSLKELLKSARLVKGNSGCESDKIVDITQRDESNTASPDESHDVSSKETSSSDQNESIQEEIPSELEENMIKPGMEEASVVVKKDAYDFDNHRRQIEDTLNKELASFRDMVKISTVVSYDSVLIDDE